MNPSTKSGTIGGNLPPSSFASVHGSAGPGAELFRAQAQGVHEQGQHADGERPAKRHQGNGQDSVLVFDAAHRGHGADRRGAANGETGGYEEGALARKLHQAGQPIRAGETQEHDGGNQEKRKPAKVEDIDNADLQAQQHDARPHVVLAGEVQPRAGASGSPCRRARYICS